MVRFPPKKGPRMTVASQGTDRTQDFGQDELDAALNALAPKVYDAIEDARSKMTEEEREKADRNADIILKTGMTVQKTPKSVKMLEWSFKTREKPIPMKELVKLHNFQLLRAYVLGKESSSAYYRSKEEK